MKKRSMVLITGAAGGIGSATAKLFAETHHDVVITDIKQKENELKELARQLTTNAETKIIPLPMDVTDPTSISQAIASLKDEHGIQHLNVLINNAGKSLITTIDETNINEASEVIDVLLKGPINTTLLFLPMLRAGLPDASIITVSSMAALITPPFLAIYGAAKAGLDKIMETWRHELEFEGIHVGLIHVGATKTNIIKKGELSPTFNKLFQIHEDCNASKDKNHQKPDTMARCQNAEKIVRFFERPNQVPPSRVAETILQMVRKRKQQSFVTKSDSFIAKTRSILFRPARKKFESLVKTINDMKQSFQ